MKNPTPSFSLPDKKEMEALDSELVIDHELGIVSVISGGTVIPARAKAGARAARKVASELDYKVIFDLSQAKVSLSLADAYFLPRDPSVPRTHPEEVAIVGDESLSADWARFLELTAANMGIMVRVFPDREAAVAALSEEKDTGVPAVLPEAATILVVDDDPDVLRMTSRVFQNAGYKTLEASDGQEGLEIAQREHPDLVLLDVVMPDLDGIEVCRRLKADPELTETIVALASGVRTSLEDQEESLASDPDAYLPRPLSKKELLSSVQFLLDKQRRHGN